MQRTSEKWEIQIGKHRHIISGEEMKVILGAGENRFVRFRDLVINPAFVQDMVLIESDSAGKLAPVYDGDLPAEEWLAKHEKEVL